MARTRREFLTSGAGALGALAAFPAVDWRHVLSRGSSTAPPVRCVTLGAAGVISPGSTQDYSACRPFVLDSGTRWVRMWADWPSLQPEASVAPQFGRGAWRLRSLDRQIARAGADGVRVILTSYRFPGWANGTAGLIPPVDAVYELHDRVPAFGYTGAPKPLGFRLPPDLGPGSAWGRWIEFLIARYRGRIAALELINEPNSQVWPLEDPSPTADPYDQGPIAIHRAVAQMFATASGIAASYDPAPLLMGPATSDGAGDSRLAIGYDTFTGLLLDELDRIGFVAGPRFAWSQHNYTDVEESLEHTRAEEVQGMLAARWTGMPALFIPEGGARLTRLAQLYGTTAPDELRTLQASLLARNVEQMAQVAGGAGVAMVGQYLFFTDPHFDSGLCEVDGTQRPAYARWRALPP
jgi:hypothetical protein